MKHFLTGLVVQSVKLNPKLSGQNIQQIIAVLKTDDGLNIAKVYDTAFPDINEAHVNIMRALPDLVTLVTLLKAFVDEGCHQVSFGALATEDDDTTLACLINRTASTLDGK